MAELTVSPTASGGRSNSASSTIDFFGSGRPSVALSPMSLVRSTHPKGSLQLKPKKLLRYTPLVMAPGSGGRVSDAFEVCCPGRLQVRRTAIRKAQAAREKPVIAFHVTRGRPSIEVAGNIFARAWFSLGGSAHYWLRAMHAALGVDGN